MAIPVSQALIGWIIDAEYRIANVIVLDDRHVRGDQPRDADLAAWNARTHTSGVCLDGWAQTIGPVVQFAIMAVEGFADHEEAHKALEQFAKIEGCDWAQTAWNMT